jgi:hypothetical protein
MIDTAAKGKPFCLIAKIIGRFFFLHPRQRTVPREYSAEAPRHDARGRIAVGYHIALSG